MSRVCSRVGKGPVLFLDQAPASDVCPAGDCLVKKVNGHGLVAPGLRGQATCGRTAAAADAFCSQGGDPAMWEDPSSAALHNGALWKYLK